MDFENDGVNVEIADPQDTDNVDTGVSEAASDAQAATEETADPQSAEVNAHFAELRRKQELDAIKAQFSNTASENAKLKAELDRVRTQAKTALSPFAEGTDLDSMLLFSQAQQKGISVAELQAQQAQEQVQAQAQLSVKQDLDYYRNIVQEVQAKEAQRLAIDDLKAVQALDPNIKSLDEMGEEFVKLRFTANPLTGQLFTVNDVYNHLKSKIKPTPPTSGAVANAKAAESDFLTDEEINKITPSEYAKNPKLRERALKTLFK